MFDIDLNKYRIVDLSYEVVPPGTEDRPFIVKRGLLGDDAFKHDITTHSHVGTHVECPSHFFHPWDNAKSVTDLPLTAFMGRGILLPVRQAGQDRAITPAYLQEMIGDIIQPGDIIVCRDEMLAERQAFDKQNPDPKRYSMAYFDYDAPHWLDEHQVKMLIFDDTVDFGPDIPTGRRFHEILQGEDVTFVEFVRNLDQLRRREFYIMCLPFKARGLDSMWARLIAIEEI